VTALVLAQVPDAHVSSAIATNQFSLIRVNDYIIYRDAMGVVPLHIAASRIPNLDRAVLG
jgi:hypothetical protein